MDMFSQSAEPTRGLRTMYGDAFHPVVEDPHHLAVAADPDIVAQIFWRGQNSMLAGRQYARREIPSADHFVIGKAIPAKRIQFPLLGRLKRDANSPLRRSENPCVRDGSLPVIRVRALLCETFKASSLQGSTGTF